MIKLGKFVLMAALVGASTAFARSAFDFDTKHIELSYITRMTNPARVEAGNLTSEKVWLGPQGRIEISVTLQNLNNQVVFSQGSNAASSTWELLVVSGKWRLGYNGEYVYVEPPLPQPAIGTRYDIVCERKDGKVSLVINDQLLIEKTGTGELGMAEGLAFFQRKNGNKWNNCPSTMKFHGAKVYNADVLVADYVPIVNNFYGNAGLMDKVEGATSIEDTSVFKFDAADRAASIDKMLCNLGKDDGGAEVDWVASSCQEIVPTDFVPAGTDVIKVKLALTDSAAHYTIFSAGGAGPGGTNRKMMELLCMSAGTWRPSIEETTGTTCGSWTAGTDYEVEFSLGGGLKVNGTVCGALPSSTGDFIPTYGLSFFSRMQLGALSGGIDPLSCASKCKIYWAKVYASDGTTLKADFVPYVDGDGFAGLKDTVSGKVYLPLFGRLTPSNGARPQAVYLAPGTAGDNYNAGTFRSPIQSPDTARQRTVTGGTIYLKDGTYTFGSCTWVEGDNSAHSVVGASGDPAKVIIDGNASGNRVFCTRWDSNAVYKNLTFRNCRGTASGAAIYTDCALIENCVFTNNEVSISDQSKAEGGIVYAAGGSVVRGCVFRDNRATGTSSLGSGAMIGGSAVLENCLFDGNTGNGPEFRCCTVYISGGCSAVVRNCTFVKNHAIATDETATSGIRCDSANARIVNTVFCGNTCSLGGSLTHSVICYMNCDSSVFTNCAADYAIGNGCRTITSDVFADWTAGDYAPYAKSRLINRGNAYLGGEAQPSDYGIDLAGNPRFVGSDIDIGAYEWQGRDPLFGLFIVVK